MYKIIFQVSLNMIDFSNIKSVVHDVLKIFKEESAFDLLTEYQKPRFIENLILARPEINESDAGLMYEYLKSFCYQIASSYKKNKASKKVDENNSIVNSLSDFTTYQSLFHDNFDECSEISSL